jgi:hypothetical protein
MSFIYKVYSYCLSKCFSSPNKSYLSAEEFYEHKKLFIDLLSNENAQITQSITPEKAHQFKERIHSLPIPYADSDFLKTMAYLLANPTLFRPRLKETPLNPGKNLQEQLAIEILPAMFELPKKEFLEKIDPIKDCTFFIGEACQGKDFYLDLKLHKLSDLGNHKIITITKDCLSWKPEEFKKQMHFILQKAEKATHVCIPSSKNPLIFSKENFSLLIEKGPEAFTKPYSITAKDGEIVPIDPSIFCILTGYRNNLSSSLWNQFEDTINLRDFEKNTIEHIVKWIQSTPYKEKADWSDNYPVLTKKEETKFVQCLQYLCADSPWTQEAYERHTQEGLVIDNEDLQDLTWEELIQIYKDFSHTNNFARIGNSICRVQFFGDIAESKPSCSPKEIDSPYFQLPNGQIIAGSLNLLFNSYNDWTRDFTHFPTKENPFIIPNDLWLDNLCNDYLTKNVYEFLKDYVFIELLDVAHFFENAGKMESHLALRERARLFSHVWIKGKDWATIEKELAQYPNATKITLIDFGKTTWSRNTVEAYVAHGAITEEDMNISVVLELPNDKQEEKMEFVLQPLSMWKCFLREGVDINACKGLTAAEFRAYWDAVFFNKKPAYFDYHLSKELKELLKTDEVLAPLTSDFCQKHPIIRDAKDCKATIETKKETFRLNKEFENERKIQNSIDNFVGIVKTKGKKEFEIFIIKTLSVAFAALFLFKAVQTIRPYTLSLRKLSPW